MDGGCGNLGRTGDGGWKEERKESISGVFTSVV